MRLKYSWRELLLWMIVAWAIGVMTGMASGCAMPIEPEEPANYDEARRATIGAWEDVIGRVSKDCYDYTKEFLVVEVDDIEEKEPGNRTTIGRTYFEKKQIHIVMDRDVWQKEDTAVHEYTHILANCEFGDPDAEEMNHRLWIDYGTETVEAVGCAGW